jgi:hypothetical protein
MLKRVPRVDLRDGIVRECRKGPIEISYDRDPGKLQVIDTVEPGTGPPTAAKIEAQPGPCFERPENGRFEDFHGQGPIGTP